MENHRKTVDKEICMYLDNHKDSVFSPKSTHPPLATYT